MELDRRLSFEESCRVLQQEHLIACGELPAMPAKPPGYADEGLGVNFFRTALVAVKLNNLTLPRTFFGRSEIRDSSFHNTDLTGSTANWNDFIQVDFNAADLSQCDFRACLLEQVKFTDACLAETDFRYCGFRDCDFSGAEMSGTKLTRKAGTVLRLSPERQAVIDWQEEDGEEPAGG